MFREERLRRDDERRDIHRRAAADLRQYAGMTCHPWEMRTLARACAVICEAVALGARVDGQVMAQGIADVVAVSRDLLDPPDRSQYLTTPRVDGAWALPGYRPVRDGE